MRDEVQLIIETGGAWRAYRARLRVGTPTDRTALVRSWGPAFEDGPDHWTDRDWPWDTFGTSDLHLDPNPQWLVIADELEPGASGELFGVLVTTGPATAQEAGLGELSGPGKPLARDCALLWVEHIAIAPSIRFPDCPASHRRKQHVKGVGPQLMRVAIERSEALGLSGRIGLHAEGDRARDTYTVKWLMICLGEAVHRAGDTYPVCFGDVGWAAQFCARLDAKEGGKP